MNSDTQKPVYVDSNGRWWDETYRLCKTAPIVSHKALGKAEADGKPGQDRQLLAVVQSNPRPNPHDFQNYQEYELALIKWKEIIDSALLSAEILLPAPQGRTFYRPPFHPHSTLQCPINTSAPARFPYYTTSTNKISSFSPSIGRNKYRGHSPQTVRCPLLASLALASQIDQPVC